MAVIKAFRGVQVTIRVNDEALEEYTAGTPDTNTTATRYIEVESDQTFEIHADVNSLKKDDYICHGLAWHIAIDGIEVDRRLIYQSMIKTHFKNGKTQLSAGRPTDDGKVRPYRFAELDIAAEEPTYQDADEKARAETVGTIKIVVHHVFEGDIAGDAALVSQLEGVSSVGKSDVKGKETSHSVEYGEAIHDRSGNVSSEVEYLDPSQPAAVYEFRYRSHYALVKLGIIAAPPTPTPLHARDPSTLTLEEIVQLQTEAGFATAAAAAARPAIPNQPAMVGGLRGGGGDHPPGATASSQDGGGPVAGMKREPGTNLGGNNRRRKVRKTIITLDDDGNTLSEVEEARKEVVAPVVGDD